MKPPTTYPMPTEVASRKLYVEPNFIALKRYKYKLNELEKRYEECPDHIIAQALLMDEKEVEPLFKKIVLKLRNLMGIEL